MEKLIHYLYECAQEWVMPNIHSEDLMNLEFLKPFIKWLVENDKIDFVKVIQKKWHWEIDNIMLSMKEREYLELLMLLAIQNEPLTFLISILK